MVIRVLHIFVFLLTSVVVFAQAEIRFFVTASNKTVEIGKAIDLTYKFEGGRPGSFTPPDLQGFRRIGPIMQGSEVHVVNGRYSNAYTFSFRITPEEEGTFTIPEATVEMHGKEFYSNTITLKAIKARSGKEGLMDRIAENYFIKVFASKTDVYVGEQIKVTYKMYKRGNLAHLAHNSQPGYEGFWKEELSTPEDFQLSPETIDGIRYETGILESVILFPQKAGTITIDPYILDTKVPVRTQRRSIDPFWDDFFGANIQHIDFQLKSPALTINVKSLPGGQPAAF